MHSDPNQKVYGESFGVEVVEEAREKIKHLIPFEFANDYLDRLRTQHPAVRGSKPGTQQAHPSQKSDITHLKIGLRINDLEEQISELENLHDYAGIIELVEGVEKSVDVKWRKAVKEFRRMGTS